MKSDSALNRLETFKTWYESKCKIFEKVCEYVSNRIDNYIRTQNVNIAYFNTRVKSLDSVVQKAKKKIKVNGEYVYKYNNPKNDIMDFAGVRFVAYLPSEVNLIASAVEEIFGDCIRWEDSENKVKKLGSNKVGYLSIHYIVEINSQELEYRDLNGLKCEIQIRTVLQDAWAQIFHDRIYKETIENESDFELLRKVNLLSGTLELVDEQINEVIAHYDSVTDIVNDRAYNDLLNQSITEDSLVKYISISINGNCEKYYSSKTTLDILNKWGIYKIRDLDYIVDRGFIHELSDLNISLTVDKVVRYILVIHNYEKFFNVIDCGNSFYIEKSMFTLLDNYIDMNTVCNNYNIKIKGE